MKIGIVTLFPEMFEAVSAYGISGRAIKQGLVTLNCFNPRAYTHDKHQTVDDRPYGGGPGMVMRVEPLAAATDAALAWLDVERHKATVIYLSPQGRQLDAKSTVELRDKQNLVLICGRYEGVDERFIRHYVDAEWSIGDYVLSGGELPAMVMLDAVIRKLPGALGDEQSAEQDSFELGLLDCPHYTRPECALDDKVPDVLMSGDHEKIRRWREQQSLARTLERRPDLLRELDLNEEQLALLDALQAETKF
jgi:tRNA (guanine37-N1)-methyltransferase